MKAERFVRIVLDAGCIIVGLGVIVHQTLIVPPGQASGLLLTAAVTILGIPAGVGVLSQLRSGGTATTGPSSPSPSPSSPSPSSSSPSAGEP